jgi:hypothetical protein
VSGVVEEVSVPFTGAGAETPVLEAPAEDDVWSFLVAPDAFLTPEAEGVAGRAFTAFSEDVFWAGFCAARRPETGGIATLPLAGLAGVIATFAPSRFWTPLLPRTDSCFLAMLSVSGGPGTLFAEGAFGALFVEGFSVLGDDSEADEPGTGDFLFPTS